MKTGRIGPIKVMMMPLTMKPPHSNMKIKFCAEVSLAGTVCVSEGIMAFCRSHGLSANVAVSGRHANKSRFLASLGMTKGAQIVVKNVKLRRLSSARNGELND